VTASHIAHASQGYVGTLACPSAKEQKGTSTRRSTLLLPIIITCQQEDHFTGYSYILVTYETGDNIK
jgi:hypothetical protein